MIGGTAFSQPARTFVLGEGAHPWTRGGDGIDPVLVVDRSRAILDTTNIPENAIDFKHRPGWIGPLRFDEDENIAARVLAGGSVTAPNAGQGHEEQLRGIVNGDHLTAFELKPTLFEPRVTTRGIRIILDFGAPVGVQRVRFYPRNTVVETPSAPFHSDFLRGYELWVNRTLTSSASPDVLVARSTANEEAVVEVEVPLQYVRYLTLKSLADEPFEIDEIEVYGAGFLERATYLSDLIDLGANATIGPVEWQEEGVGNAAFSHLSVRMRTGSDDSPIKFLRIVKNIRASSGQPGQQGVEQKKEEVEAGPYFELEPPERAPLEEDEEHWSPWSSVENGGAIRAPNPRSYIQFRLEFEGALLTALQVDRLSFAYVQPPIADTLTAEIYPRLAEAEKPASFRYAVRLRKEGAIRGFDRLEVDTNVEVERVRQVALDGRPIAFAVDFIRPEMFSLSFETVQRDRAVLEFTFDLPIFRFGTTFSGRAFHSSAGAVPQPLAPGNALYFGPGDADETSGLAVEIPRPQIGKLVGEISVVSRVVTPNGDGVDERFELFFNLLQLLRPAPVALEIYNLAGRRVRTAFAEERGIGPVRAVWDGRREDGGLAGPGIYIWVLCVRAKAFEERHAGTLAVVY